MNGKKLTMLSVATAILAVVLWDGIASSAFAEKKVVCRVEVDTPPQPVIDELTIHVRVICTLPNGKEVELSGQRYEAKVTWPDGSTRQFKGHSCKPKTINVPGGMPAGPGTVGVNVTRGAAKGQVGIGNFQIL